MFLMNTATHLYADDRVERLRREAARVRLTRQLPKRSRRRSPTSRGPTES